MTVLHLGVNDIPYATPSKSPRPGRRVPSYAGTNKTTGDVAEILERRYGVMAVFAKMHEANIANAATDSIGGALENLLAGAPPLSNSLAEAMSTIEASFKQFLANREMDGAVKGVPTLAAQLGHSHRFKHPYARRPSRPSFIDTGLYQANFRAWTEG